jgi:hypothetical protein
VVSSKSRLPSFTKLSEETQSLNGRKPRILRPSSSSRGKKEQIAPNQQARQDSDRPRASNQNNPRTPNSSEIDRPTTANENTHAKTNNQNPEKIHNNKKQKQQAEEIINPGTKSSRDRDGNARVGGYRASAI